MILFRIVWRAVVVWFGLILAGAAAALALAVAREFPMLWTHFEIRGADPDLRVLQRVLDGAVVGVIFTFVLRQALGPALMFALIMEILGVRSLLVYLAAGAFGGWSVQQTAGAGPYPPDAAIAAGLVAGFVYWLLAGLGAGIFRRTKAAEATDTAPPPAPAPGPEPIREPAGPTAPEGERPRGRWTSPTGERFPLPGPPAPGPQPPPDRKPVVERTRR